MPESFVDIDCVRITPPWIEFIESVSTTKYQRKFTLQNVGKNKVFVAIPTTDTKDFEMEFLPRGLYLSPGLRIVKTVKLNYFKGCSRECLISICINEKNYDYLLLLNPSPIIISIDPKIVDFGLLNAGNVDVSRLIVIENGSDKEQSFTVDLKNCSKKVTVEPTKGKIKPCAISEILVQMIGFAELTIESQFHIKCANQIITVPVKGKIIISKLESLHPNATEHFTLLELPPTYFGLTSQADLFLRNHSAIAHMFATMGEVRNKRVNIAEMKEKSLHFKFFNMYPTDGVFQSNETKLFQFKFSPIELNITTKCIPFYFCTILLNRFKCTSLNKESVIDYNFDLMSNTSHGKSSSAESSMKSSDTNIFELLSSSSYLLDQSVYSKYNLDSIHDFIRIHLYATAEVPSVQIIPDEINITDIQLKKYETRTLELNNLSQHLPIILKYKKTPFITLNCDKLYLRPLEKVEIGIKIDPATVGTTVTKLTFDLMYYDVPKVNSKCKTIGQANVKITFDVTSITKYPTPQLNLALTPNYIRDVGKYCRGIKFNTKLQETKCITVTNYTYLNKTCRDLVAFPNDTQKSLRPCRSLNTYRTIFTKHPRYVAPTEPQYELDIAGISRRTEIKNYYTKYIRQQFITKSRSTSALNTDYEKYDITTMKKVLCADVQLCKSAIAFDYQRTRRGLYFIPLTPQEMYNIHIFPPIIKTTPIAPYSPYQFRIKIANKNEMPIRILLCSDRLNLNYDEGNRHIVRKKQDITVKITYKSSHPGYFISNLYLLINDSTVLNVSILADVVPLALMLSCTNISLDNVNDRKYIELKNDINIAVSYCWNIGHTNFTIEPSSGIVNAGEKIVCVVNYLPQIQGPTETSAQLLSGSVNKQTVKLSVKKSPCQFILMKAADFSAIPLNEPIKNMITFKNCSFFSVEYYINECDLPKGFTVFPVSGNIDPVGLANVSVTVQLTNCFKFNYRLKINSHEGATLEVPIYGFVVYPEVAILPKTINIPKIPASTVTNAKFTIQNISRLPLKIRFDMTEYEEFLISEDSYPWKRNQVGEFYLSSQSIKSLYIHFLPKGASSCCFYLPIIINDILGPPVFNDVASTRTDYYLFDSIDNFKILDTPITLPCIKVHTLATNAKIQISKTLIKFKTLPAHRDAYSSIIISNPQTTNEDVCIRTDELKHPLYIERKSGIGAAFQRNAIVLHFKPNDSTSFKVLFSPQSFEFGRYEIHLPLYLRSDESFKEHNAITIIGEYERPSICIYFADLKYFLKGHTHLTADYLYDHYPLPLYSKEENVKLKMKAVNHLENCIVSTKVQGGYEVNWIILNDTKEITDSKGSYTVNINSFYTIVNSGPFYHLVEVWCSCGGYWIARTQCSVENSLFVIYERIEYFFKEQGKFSESSFPTYPLFPDSSHVLLDFFNECCRCAEYWLHSQVFFGLCTYTIPDALIPFLGVPEGLTVTRQTQLSRLPILHILGNLLGPDTEAMLKLRDIPTEEISQIKAIYEINQRALDLVKNHGGIIPTLRPECLLCPDHFFAYYKKIYDYSEYPLPQSLLINDEESFYRYSKQCWMDIIFQMYSRLYLNKLVTTYENFAKTGKLKDTPLAAFFAVNHEKINPEFYSDSESLVLNWLQFHYNGNKGNVWKKGDRLQNIKVDLYNNTLNDGLVFAVVIAAYCPYLINLMQDMHIPPSTHEDVYHNIIRMIQCLEQLNYTFIITPEQIIQGHSIRLFMFSAYLFEVLPHMYPVETTTIKTGLSSTAYAKVEIFNENDFPIAYKAIFIGSQDGCFTTFKKVFEIPKRKKLVINVNYFAKFSRNIECVVLFSGEVLGYRYANNKCINLIGIPDLNHPSSTITYTQELFQAKCYHFVVQSPYKMVATYDMQQTYENLRYALELANVIYHLDRDRIACTRLIVLNKSFDFDENGQCIVHAAVGTLANDAIAAWLYFKNVVVGDFAVKFVSLVKDSTKRELLKVKIPNIMKATNEGPYRLVIEIPNRNKLFLNTMKALLVMVTEDDESKLWKRISETEMGLNILGHLFTNFVDNETEPRIYSKDKGRVYKINTDKYTGIVFPESVVIEDENRVGFTKIPFTLKTIDECPANFLLTLEGEHWNTKRYYTVCFTKD